MATPARRIPADPYALDPAAVEDPPRTLAGALRRIGPGMILSASIVGSGELIATTTLGAEVGYVALWVILISCVIKPAVQSEMGRFTIATAETGLAGFNRVPGPRFKVNWIVWMWALMVLVTLFQIGAMFGGVAQVLSQLAPAVPPRLWILGLVGLTLALLLGGGYERVEKLATIKVALFTMLTFLCAMLLTRQPEYFSWAKVAEGLSFRLPPDGLITAVAVFGITGVGAAELFMYPYWCIEKGYARFAGARSDDPAWRERVAGWTRVMNVDILASMILYTVATIAFYLLGAGVLHGRGLVPSARDMIPVLSRMYTETLGPWSLWLFFAGAVATLYGTIFAATAANARVYADMCRLLGAFQSNDYAARLRWRRRFVCALTLIPGVLILLFQSPVVMVKIGGVAQAIMLPVIAGGILYLRHRHTPKEARSGLITGIGVWIAAAAIFAGMIAYALMTLR